MSTLVSEIDTDGSQFAANAEAMALQLDTVTDQQRLLTEIGGRKYIDRHRDRGRLLVRERIELLLDRDTAFLELSPLAGWGTRDPLGGGLVTGIGVVSGTEVVIAANDPTVKGGSISPTTIAKMLRAQDISRENRLPLVNLTESGGGDLPRNAEIFVPGGAMFRNLTQLSSAGIPTITMVFGSSTAGGAYMPGMSDYTILVGNQARVYLGGPPLVKMAINEDADEEELGGAEMHARTSGLADYFARDEVEAIAIARAVVAHLHWRKSGPEPAADPRPPRHDPSELLGVYPSDMRQPFDVREVLARILDDSMFEEFKSLYGPNLIAGWGALAGYPIGVIGNNGVIFNAEAQKGAQFIQLCEQIGTPLLFVQNITGFMVGTRYEQAGIVKDGAKLINSVSNTTVPKITLMVGASYGAGNYGMSGWAFQPRFVFTWPSHRLALMGPKQLAGVLSIIRRQAAQRAGGDFDEAADLARSKAIEEQIDAESTALSVTGRLHDDGIVDPRDTRTVLAIALSAVHSSPIGGAGRFGVYRM